MNVLFHLLRELFRKNFCVSAGRRLVLSRSKALKLFCCILVLNFNFKALEWFWLRLRGIILWSYSRRSGRGLGGFRPFTVVPLFHPRVYRKFLQNLQGKLNSRIKILKPRARIYIALPKSRFPKLKCKFQKLKMKIENRAWKAHNILA